MQWTKETTLRYKPENWSGHHRWWNVHPWRGIIGWKSCSARTLRAHFSIVCHQRWRSMSPCAIDLLRVQSICFPGWVSPGAVRIALTSFSVLRGHTRVSPKCPCLWSGSLGADHCVTSRRKICNGHHLVCTSVGHFREVWHTISPLKERLQINKKHYSKTSTLVPTWACTIF